MPSRTETSTASPRKEESKVQDGRVQKPKTKKGEPKPANYRIDGRTFACEGCKNGHRVSRCTHAKDRPLHMTHDPGRPAGDQKRRCDCPKTCSCTTKNCKCERACTCTQKMYMLVYVPVKGPESNQDKDQGEWRIDKEVITDLKGNKLSEEEITARMEQKALQKKARLSRASTTETEIKQIKPENAGTVLTIMLDEGQYIDGIKDDRHLHACCRHQKKIKDESLGAAFQSKDKRLQCSCGPGCKCAFCLDHPNNNTSQRIAQQQAAHFDDSSSSANNHPPKESYLPSVNVVPSCMGTAPQFAWFDTPNPTSGDLESIFGSAGQGYCLSYEIEGPFNNFNNPNAQPMVPQFDELAETSQFMQEPNLALSEFPLAIPTESLFTPAVGMIPPNAISSRTAIPPAFPNDPTYSRHIVGQGTVVGFHGINTHWEFPYEPGIADPLTSTWPNDDSLLQAALFSNPPADANGHFQPHLAQPMTALAHTEFDFTSLPLDSALAAQNATPEIIQHQQHQVGDLFHEYATNDYPVGSFPAFSALSSTDGSLSALPTPTPPTSITPGSVISNPIEALQAANLGAEPPVRSCCSGKGKNTTQRQILFVG